MIRHRIAAGRLVVALGLAMVLCVASLTGAFADVLTPIASGTTVDFSPMLVEAVNFAIVIGAPAVTALVFALVLQLQRLAGVKVSAEKAAATRAKVDQAMIQAAAFARRRAAAAGPITVDLGRADIAAGAEYAMRSIPDTLKSLGITDAASERLKEMVEARLGPPLLDLQLGQPIFDLKS